MAGMLPGVESARRRRFHGSGGWADSPGTGASGFGNSARRSSFGLSNPAVSSSRNTARQDERLGGVAREARERLDEKLRAKWKSQPVRLRGDGEERRGEVGDLQMEVYGLNKVSGSKRFEWGKMRWKAAEQEECAVCLEQFKVGETLAHLPCAHRFHSRCLVPWLHNNAHCPCCRTPMSNSSN